MNIKNLLRARGVEFTNLLTRGVRQCLLEVLAKPMPSTGGFCGDLVLFIKTLGAPSGIVLGVEILESRGEALGDSMLCV